jgi:hypothetical protein
LQNERNGDGARLAACALRNEFAAMSALSLRSGQRMRKLTRGLPSSTAMAASLL